MRLKRILGLTALAWTATLPSAISTSCSSNKLEFELRIIEGEGVHLTQVKAYENTDLIIPYTLTDSKQIDPLNSSVSVNFTSLSYYPYPAPKLAGYWTFNSEEYKIIISAVNIQRSWPKNNYVTVNIATK